VAQSTNTTLVARPRRRSLSGSAAAAMMGAPSMYQLMINQVPRAADAAPDQLRSPPGCCRVPLPPSPL
jgi:hypothetical protein